MKNNYKCKNKIKKYSFPRAPSIISAELLVLCSRILVERKEVQKGKSPPGPDVKKKEKLKA